MSRVIELDEDLTYSDNDYLLVADSADGHTKKIKVATVRTGLALQTAVDTINASKGANSGIATLDSSGKLPTTQLPALAISDTFVVGSQAAMLALTAQAGDIAIRTDVGKTYILSTNSPATLADWKEIVASGGGAVNTAFFNVKNYGAVGDGSHDDTSAIQSCINAALATAKGTSTVYFPAGTYKITATLVCSSATGTAGGKGVYLLGDGHEASQIFKNSSFGPAVTFNGNGGPAGNNTQFGGMENITVNGNASTGGLVQTNSAQQMLFKGCSFIGSNDVAWDFNTMQDSYFLQCTFNNCGSLTKRVIEIYGSVNGTSNMLWFDQIRVETFLKGALYIYRGAGATGGGNNGFFFSQCKFENYPTVAGDICTFDSYTQQLVMDKIFFSIGQYNTAYSTPADFIVFGDGTASSPGYNQASFRDIFVNAGPTANIGNTIINIKGGGALSGTIMIDNVYSDATLNTSLVSINGAANVTFGIGLIGGPGTSIAGDGSGTRKVLGGSSSSSAPSVVGSEASTVLAHSNATGTLASITTASITPVANQLLLLTVAIRNGASINPTTPTVAGNGLTWALVGTANNDNSSSSRRSVYVFQAIGPAPTPGTITVTFGESETDAAWIVEQIAGAYTTRNVISAVDLSGSNGKLSATLGAFNSPTNGTYIAGGTDGVTGATATGGVTISSNDASAANVGVATAFSAANVATPTLDWSANGNGLLGVVAFELVAMPSLTRNITTLSGTATLGATAGVDYTVFLNTGAVPTLPTAVGNTNRYTIKNISTGNINLATTGGQTIDGNASPLVIAPGISYDIVADGTNWRVV